MITPPRRAVTRFLIPFIDVLILLFCIFLLMPFVSKPEETKETKETPPDTKRPEDLQQLQAEIAALKRQINLLRSQKTPLVERVSIRVLDIDKTDGRLFSVEPDAGRVEIKDQGDALRLINRQKQMAGGKDVMFLILYPRELSGYPLKDQIQTYHRWFQDVPHAFDNPWVTRSEN